MANWQIVNQIVKLSQYQMSKKLDQGHLACRIQLPLTGPVAAVFAVTVFIIVVLFVVVLIVVVLVVVVLVVIFLFVILLVVRKRRKSSIC